MTSPPTSARRAAGVSFAAAALVTAATVVTPANGAGRAVAIRNFAFVPQVLTITAGTTVTWTNNDDSPHTIMEANKVFRSAALDTGDAFSHTFATPGDFRYLCTIHPMMKGEIIVKPAQN